MSRPAAAAPSVARWPKINARLNADGTGVLTIDGREQRLDAPSIDTARATVLERVTRTAARLDRPVRLTTTDPDGEWELAVHPDGSVDELAGRPAPEPREPPVLAEREAATTGAALPADAPEPPPLPPVAPRVVRATPPAPDPVALAPDDSAQANGARMADASSTPALTRSQRRWAGPSAPRSRVTRPRARARILVPLALLLIAGALAAVLATNGPDTVVKQQPAAPAVSEDHNVVDDAIADARRRGAARRAAGADRQAAAAKRKAQAALRKRVALRQARQRRALNRRVAARQARARAAAAAARRRAAAGRPAAPPPPAATRRPRATPPPPPPPPPAATPCGDFDLC